MRSRVSSLRSLKTWASSRTALSETSGTVSVLTLASAERRAVFRDIGSSPLEKKERPRSADQRQRLDRVRERSRKDRVPACNGEPGPVGLAGVPPTVRQGGQGGCCKQRRLT